MSERAMCFCCGKLPEMNAGEGYCEVCWRDYLFREAVTRERPKAEEAITALRRLTNSSAGIEALKQALGMEHRTNQQLVCRAVVALLERWYEDAKRGPGYYDARNEASVEFARSVFENVPERKRYFPYI